MTDAERDLGRRWFEEVWNQGRRESIAEMLAPDGVIHDGGTITVGPEGFYRFYERISKTFSNLHLSVEDTFANADRICVRWSCTAKHTGDGLGFVPTGKTLHVTGITIIRVALGQIAEAWQNWDMLGMIEQIKGTVPGETSATYMGAP